MATKSRSVINITLGLLLVLLVISPCMMGFIGIYSMANSIDDAKQKVRQLDHESIRDVGRDFLLEMEDKSNRMIESNELPDLICKTEPNFVHFADGVLYIEYGGGFAHYGLAIPSVNTEYRGGERLTDGIFFYEAE